MADDLLPIAQVKEAEALAREIVHVRDQANGSVWLVALAMVFLAVVEELGRDVDEALEDFVTNVQRNRTTH